jgi:transposase
MVAVGATLPDLETLNAEALKDLLRATHQQLLARQSEIEHLRLLITQLKRMQFGRKSEKLERQIEQLELRLEGLQSQPTNPTRSETGKTTAAESSAKARSGNKPSRRPLPEHLPRETQTYKPEHQQCPKCGGKLRPLGEDVSEILEYVPARFKVIRACVRPNAGR